LPQAKRRRPEITTCASPASIIEPTRQQRKILATKAINKLIFNDYLSCTEKALAANA
jgi:hypothetical protein